MKIQFDSHLLDQQDEDIAFLMANGASLEQACARVGVSVDTYERRRSPRSSKRADA